MESPMEKLQTSGDDVILADSISNLPDSILCYILSFLETKSAVATSVLSRRWKLLWTKVTTLDLVCSKRDPETANMSFVQFVNHVLLYIDPGCLCKFRLIWSEGCGWDAVYVSMWVSYAIARNIRFLKFEIDIVGLDVNVCSRPCVPDNLFTCVELESLIPRGPIFVEIPSNVCLPKLKKLILCLVNNESDETVHRLISGCPVLENLEVEREGFDGVLVYKISSPSLRFLKFHGYEGLNSIRRDGKKLEIDTSALESLQLRDCERKEFSLNNLMSVNEVKLNLDLFFLRDWSDELADRRPNLIVKVIEALVHVKYLKLEGTIMQALSNGTTTPLSSRFARLTRLDIECHCCQWRSLNQLLHCFNKLEILEIRMVRCANNNHKKCWKDPDLVPECLLSSLAMVSFFGFRGREDEMAMLKYIVNHGAVMKTVSLYSASDCCGLQNKHQMLKEISLFPRSCQIHFDSYDLGCSPNDFEKLL